jgi:hypothetical protein
MPTHKYQCTNLANCDLALSKQTIEIAEGDEAICPECKQKLPAPVPERSRSGKKKKWILAGAGALVVLVVILFFVSPPSRDPAKADGLLTQYFPTLPQQSGAR